MNQWAPTLSAKVSPPLELLCLSHDPAAKLPFLKVFWHLRMKSSHCNVTTCRGA